MMEKATIKPLKAVFDKFKCLLSCLSMNQPEGLLFNVKDEQEKPSEDCEISLLYLSIFLFLYCCLSSVQLHPRESACDYASKA